MTLVPEKWTGSGVAHGVAVAASWRANRPVRLETTPLHPGDVERAFQTVAATLNDLADAARAEGRRAAAEIVGVGAVIATDPELVAAAQRAAEGDDPLAGISNAVEAYARTIEALPNSELRERAADIRQVGRRVVEQIAHRDGDGIGPPSMRSFVLIADELGPADLLEYLGGGLAAAVAVRGGANSHAAIVARSVGLPLVLGVDAGILELADQTSLLVDADAGVVVADPPEADIDRARTASARAGERRTILAADRGRPHVTTDGRTFELLCNVASDMEVRVGRDSGAEGIGLVRTELPFLHVDGWPTEADHRRALEPVLTEAVGWPTTVRLLDFANDKVPPFLAGGTPGLPALLADASALAAQLRAMLDLGRRVELAIMVPMVTEVADVRTVRAAVDQAAADVGVAPVRVGAMVETRAAVEAIDDLCQVVDFLSIGTNDLTAEVLGLDRTDPRARPELTAHPRLLERVGRVVAAANASSRPLSVCGDAAAHPTTVPLLLGAGVRSFSVACVCIDETRYRLRRLDAVACADVFAEALELRDADDVAALVERGTQVVVP